MEETTFTLGGGVSAVINMVTNLIHLVVDGEGKRRRAISDDDFINLQFRMTLLLDYLSFHSKEVYSKEVDPLVLGVLESFINIIAKTNNKMVVSNCHEYLAWISYVFRELGGSFDYSIPFPFLREEWINDGRTPFGQIIGDNRNYSLYIVIGCPYCDAIIEYLNDRHILYVATILCANEVQEIKDKFGMKTVPILISPEGRVIGGFSEAQRYIL